MKTHTIYLESLFSKDTESNIIEKIDLINKYLQDGAVVSSVSYDNTPNADVLSITLVGRTEIFDNKEV